MTTPATGDRPAGYEDVDDALLEGDRPVRPGAASAVLHQRNFTILWTGTFASNVGTWMQNVALGALAFQLTHSAGYVALIGFAQLAPVLLLAAVGGMLADSLDRRMLLVVTNAEQLIFSVVLAFVAHPAHHDRTLLFLVVLAVGVGNALSGPPLSSFLPMLVEREQIPAAVSLFSTQLNLSRVIGPAIGGVILPLVHPWGIFAINAVTYLFAVAAAMAVPAVKNAVPTVEQGLARLLAGLALARRDPLIGRVLLTIFAFSLFSLAWIGLMPAVASVSLGMPTTGLAYGLLYACFGLGAAAGALAVGTVFSGVNRLKLSRRSLFGFAAALTVFAVLRWGWLAYPVVLVLGAVYFATTTGMLSALQEHVEDAVRGRVMALWMMGFGGTVPVGLLLFGKVADLLSPHGRADARSLTIVLVFGAVVALVMAAADAMGSRRYSPGEASPRLA